MYIIQYILGAIVIFFTVLAKYIFKCYKVLVACSFILCAYALSHNEIYSFSICMDLVLPYSIMLVLSCFIMLVLYFILGVFFLGLPRLIIAYCAYGILSLEKYKADFFFFSESLSIRRYWTIQEKKEELSKLVSDRHVCLPKEIIEELINFPELQKMRNEANAYINIMLEERNAKPPVVFGEKLKKFLDNPNKGLSQVIDDCPTCFRSVKLTKSWIELNWLDLSWMQFISMHSLFCVFAITLVVMIPAFIRCVLLYTADELFYISARHSLSNSFINTTVACIEATKNEADFIIAQRQFRWHSLFLQSKRVVLLKNRMLDFTCVNDW